MIFSPLPLAGPCLLDIEPHPDPRGFFARLWCRREFAEHGLETEFVQDSVSFNARKGTLRGMHFQAEPYQEAKLIRCIRGAIRDVVIDLRPGSPSFGRWTGVELAAPSHRALYVPKGFAHGFQCLQDETEIHYRISAFHVPEAARGYRHDDPAFAIDWPLPVSVMSERDRSWPDFPTQPE